MRRTESGEGGQLAQDGDTGGDDDGTITPLDRPGSPRSERHAHRAATRAHRAQKAAPATAALPVQHGSTVVVAATASVADDGTEKLPALTPSKKTKAKRAATSSAD